MDVSVYIEQEQQNNRFRESIYKLRRTTTYYAQSIKRHLGFINTHTHTPSCIFPAEFNSNLYLITKFLHNLPIYRNGKLHFRTCRRCFLRCTSAHLP